MDFKKLKEKALEIKEKAINYSAKKLTDSSLTISKKEELNKIIEKSIKTSFKNKETWLEKEYNHKSIVIFADEWSDFFKDAIYILPIIATKAFSQNIAIKLAKSKIEWVNLSDYQIKKDDLPCLVTYENKKVIKIIKGNENILKLVKSFDLDINKLITEAK